MEIIPALHARTYEEYIVKLEAIERSGATMLHIDIMDGQFVPNLTVGLGEIASVATPVETEVHLLTRDPMSLLPSLQVMGVRRVILHREVAETSLEFEILYREFRAVFAEVGVAYLPDSTLDFDLVMALQPSCVHILGNYPSDMGEPLLAMTLDRAAYWYQQLPGITLSVEGSLSDETIRELQRVGVRRFIVASHQLTVSGGSSSFSNFMHRINLEGGV